MREERKRVAAELRNAQKRKQRLKHRARLLSSEDLMTVIAMRETDNVTRRAAEAAGQGPAAPALEPIASAEAAEHSDPEAEGNVQDGDARED